MNPPLHIVQPDERLPTESVAERVRALQAQARELAAEHVRGLVESMAWTEAVAREVATGGPAYHPGAQEMAQRVADALASQISTISQIIDRK